MRPTLRIGVIVLLLALAGASCESEDPSSLPSRSRPIGKVGPVSVPDASSTGGDAGSAGGANGAPEAGSVTGGGGVDPAVARIEAQLPDLSPDYNQVHGDAALRYTRVLVAAIPQLGTAFSVLDKVGSCAKRHGVIAARGYVRPDLTAAGAVLVVSNGQLSRAGNIALQCLVEEVTGGGPASPGGFKPCFYKYSYDATTAGVADRYLVFMAGTTEQVCRDIFFPAHSVHKPKAI